MMQVKILSSGSKANCTLIRCGDKNILIDVGPTAKYINNELNKLDLSSQDIDYIFITHTHSDHIKGLSTFIKKCAAKIFVREEIALDVLQLIPKQKMQINIVANNLVLDDIEVELLTLSHDVFCSGIIIRYDDKELVYITDTGYINKKYLPKIKNKDIYIMETNYNDEMLTSGPYPFQLQQRIRGDNGHMSNRYAGSILAKCVGDNTKYVFLAHISENNNTKELALREVSDELKRIDFDLDKLILTEQLVACCEVEV